MGKGCYLEILPAMDHSYPPDFGQYVKGLAFVTQS